MARSRVDIDANISLQGLQDDIKRAIAPLENLLRRTAPGANLATSAKGAQYFGNQLADSPLGRAGGLDAARVAADMQKIGELQKEIGEAWKDGDTQAAIQGIERLQGTVGNVTKNISEGVRSYENNFKIVDDNLQAFNNSQIRQVQQKQITVQDWNRRFTDLVKLTEEGGILATAVGANPESQRVITEAKRAQAQMRSNLQKGKAVKPDAMKNYLASMSQFQDTIVQARDRSLEQLRQEVAYWDEQIAKVEQNLGEGGMYTQMQGDIEQGSMMSRMNNLEKNARFNARVNSRIIPFEGMTGLSAMDNPEIFEQFTGMFGPTIDRFDQELRNIFSNVIGGLGAAAVFLSIQSVAQINADLAQLTHNLEVYERLISQRNEASKADSVSQLRKEIEELGAVTEMTSAELSNIMVEMTRRNLNTGGMGRLLEEAQEAYENYGIAVDQVMQKTAKNFQLMQRENLNPAVYAEILQVGGGVSGEAIDRFNELIEAQQTLGLSYTELIAAALYYAETGREVDETIMGINEAVEEGNKLYQERIQESEDYSEAVKNSLLSDDVARQQRRVGQLIKQTWREVLDDAGLGGGSRFMLTLQQTALGTLKAIRGVAEAMEAIFSTPIGQVANRFLAVASAIAVLSAGLRVVSFFMGTIGAAAKNQIANWQLLVKQIQAAGGATMKFKTDIDMATGAMVRLGRAGSTAMAGLTRSVSMVRSAMVGLRSLVVSTLPMLAVTGAFVAGSMIVDASRRRAAARNQYDPTNLQSLGLLTEDDKPVFNRETGTLNINGIERNLDELVENSTEYERLSAAITGDGFGPAGDTIVSVIDLVDRVFNDREAYENLKSDLEESLENAFSDGSGRSRAYEYLGPQGQRLTRRIVEATLLDDEELLAVLEEEVEAREDAGRINQAVRQVTNRLEDTGFESILEQLNALRAFEEFLSTEAGITLQEAGNIAEDIQEYRDMRTMMDAFEEAAIAEFETTTNRAGLRDTQYRRRRAEAVIEMLSEQVTNLQNEGVDRNDPRLLLLVEAIAEQQDTIADTLVNEANERYALVSDEISAMPKGFARYERSLEAIGVKISELESAQLSAGGWEQYTDIGQMIARAQNDRRQQLRALAAYRFGLAEMRQEVLDNFEDAIRPAETILSSAYGTVTDVLEVARDTIRDYSEMNFDERQAVFGDINLASMPYSKLVEESPVFEALEAALAAAMAFDRDVRRIDEFVERLESQNEGMDMVSAVVEELANYQPSTDGGLAYLGDVIQENIYGSGGVIDTAGDIRSRIRDGLEELGRFGEGDRGFLGEAGAFLTTVEESLQAFDELQSIRDLLTDDTTGYTLTSELAARIDESLGARLQRLESELGNQQQSLSSLRSSYALLPNSSEDLEGQYEEERHQLQLEITQTAENIAQLQVDIQETITARADVQNRGVEVISTMLQEEEALQEEIIAAFEALSTDLPELFEDWNREIASNRERLVSSVSGMGLQDSSIEARIETQLSSLDEQMSEYERQIAEQQAVVDGLLEMLENATPWASSLPGFDSILGFVRNQADRLREAAESVGLIRTDAEQRIRAEGEVAYINEGIEDLDELLSDLSDTPENYEEILSSAAVLREALLRRLANSDIAKFDADTARELRERLEGYDLGEARSEAIEAASRNRISDVEQLLDADNLVESFEELDNLFDILIGLQDSDADISRINDERRTAYRSAAEEFIQRMEQDGVNLLSAEGILRWLESNGFSPERFDFILNDVIGAGIFEAVNDEIDSIQNVLDDTDTSPRSVSAYNTDLKNAVGTSSNRAAALAELLDNLEAAGVEIDESIQDRLTNLDENISLLEQEGLTGLIENLAQDAERNLTGADTPAEDVAQFLSTYSQISSLLDEATPETKRQLEGTLEGIREGILEGLIGSFGDTSRGDVRSLIAEYVASGTTGGRAEFVAEGLFGEELARLPEEWRSWIIAALGETINERILSDLEDMSQEARDEFELASDTFENQLESNPAAAMGRLKDTITQMARIYTSQLNAISERITQSTDEDEIAALETQAAQIGMDYLTNLQGFLENTLSAITALYEDGVISPAVYEQYLGQLESLSANQLANLIPNFSELADALSLTESELAQLIEEMLQLATEIELLKKSVSENLLAIQQNPAYSNDDVEVASALENLRLGEVDTTNDKRGFNSSIGSLVGILVRQIRENVQGDFENYQGNDRQRRTNQAIIAQLEALMTNPSRLLAEFGIELSPEQAEQYASQMGVELSRAIQEIAGQDIQTAVDEVMSVFWNSLSNFFQELLTIPVQMMKDAQALAEEREGLLFDEGIMQRNLANYQELYDAAVETYGYTSEEADKYREKLVELREEYGELQKSIKENEDAAKSFFEYVIDAVANFAEAFSKAVADILAAQAAAAAVNFVQDLFTGNSSGGGGINIGNILSTGVSAGVSAGTTAATTGGLSAAAASAGTSSLGYVMGAGTGTIAGGTVAAGAGLAAAAGPAIAIAAAAVAVSIAAQKIGELSEKYGELAQDTDEAGKNKFAENDDLYNFIDYDTPTVSVNINAEMNRQKLSQEASERVYAALDKNMYD